MMLPLESLIKKYNLKINGIIHAGASEGQERQEYDRLGIKKVIWIEAIPSVYKTLLINIQPYPGQMAINACLSDKDGDTVKFNVSSNEGQSSSMFELGIHKVIHPSVQYIGHLDLVTKRLDTLLNNIDSAGYNFLNMDLQGAELLALRGMGEKLSQIDYCYLEVNKKETYIGCALIGEIDEFLGAYGFKRVETGDFVDDTWTDALYVKNNGLSSEINNLATIITPDNKIPTIEPLQHGASINAMIDKVNEIISRLNQ